MRYDRTTVRRLRRMRMLATRANPKSAFLTKKLRWPYPLMNRYAATRTRIGL